MRAHNLVIIVIALSIACRVLQAQTVPKRGVDAGSLVEVKGIVVSTSGKLQKNVGCLCGDLSGKIVQGTYAGEDGVFRVKLPPGVYRIWTPGAKARAVDLTVPDGAASVSVRVNGRPQTRFRFVTPQGNPVAGIRVGQGTTNSNGMVTLSIGHDAPIEKIYFAPGWGYGYLKVDSDEELFSPDPIPVIFHTGKPVTGRAVSASTGLPLGGLVVFPYRKEQANDEWIYWNGLLGMDPYAQFAINSIAVATSRDGDGAFAVGPLPPGDYTLVFAYSAFLHFENMAEVPVHIVEGVALKPLNVKIRLTKPMYTLNARLLTKKHKPVARKEVTVEVTTDLQGRGMHAYIWEPVRRRVKTDSKGRFSLYPFPAGKFFVQISEGGLMAGEEIAFPYKCGTLDLALGDLVWADE